jgi:hypothetical protein
MVAHVNDLHEEFHDRGLSVLGVTGESAAETAPWVADHAMVYPYAFDIDFETMHWFGRRSLPSAVLIDAEGYVVYRGHPGRLKKETIEKAIDGALPVPVFEIEGWRAIRAALDDDRFAKAGGLARAAEGDEDRARLTRGVDLLLGRRIEVLETLWREGDYLAVKEHATRLADRLEGLPEEGLLRDWLGELRSDRDKRDIVRAQEKVRKLLPDGRLKSKERRDRIADLQELADRYPDTVVERDVRAAIARISGY